jgi:hypothetical protein
MPPIDEDLLDPEVRKAMMQPSQMNVPTADTSGVPYMNADQGTDPNEIKRQASVALEQKHQTGVPGIAGPNMAAMQPAATLPGVQLPEPQPNAQPAAPSIGSPTLSSTPVGPPGVNPQTGRDQAEYSRLKETGSGIHQFSQKHHIAGPLLQIADAIGSVFAPNVAQFVPGTTLHHDRLLGRQAGIVKQDGAQDKEVADAAHTEAETKALNNPKPQKAENPEADAYAVLSDPNSTPEQRKAATDALNTVKDAGKQEKGAVVHETDQGLILVHPDGTATPLTMGGKPLMGKKAPLRTEKVTRVIGGVPHEVLINAENGEDIKDEGQTKVPGESAAEKRNATESAQVEREARNNIRKAEGEYRNTQKSVGQLNSAIDAAKDANGLLTSFVPTMEVLGINAANGVHRISPAEAQAAQLPGGWSEQFNAWFDKASGGKLTPQLVAEGKALAQILTKSAYQRYKSTYDDESGIVSGYGGKDFGTRVPLIQGDDAQAAQPTHIVKNAQGQRIGTVVNGEYVADKK